MRKLSTNYKYNGEKLLSKRNIWSKPKRKTHKIRHKAFTFTIFALAITCIYGEDFNYSINNEYDNMAPAIKMIEPKPIEDFEVDIEPIKLIDSQNIAYTNIELASEQDFALRQAMNYSNIMHMSKSKIYERLLNDCDGQYSKESALYALDNLDADWNENALRNAQDYLYGFKPIDNTSKEHLYYVLTSPYGEGFTEEQAQYAIDNLDMSICENIELCK